MRRVPAILMAIFLVVPIFFAAFMTISFSTWVLDRGFYARLIEDERLYQFPDALSGATWSTDEFTDLGGFALKEVITPAYMKGQALSVLDQVFDWLQGRTRDFDLSLDLVPVKTALLGEAGKRFARALARDLPVGGSTADFVVKPKSLPRSRPSSISVDKAAAIIQAGLPGFVKSIPDTARLSDSPSFHYTPWGWGWGGRPGFSVLGGLILADIILLLFAGGFWAATAFVGGANRFERLQWFGWTLFVPAAGVFLIGLLVTLGLFSGWMQWGIGMARLESEGFDSSFTTALIDAARHVLSRVGTGFLATGAIAGGAALGLLAWSWSIARDERKEGTA